MNIENIVLKQDIEEICNTEIFEWSNFKNKIILITGSTGFIGSLITKAFLHKNEICDFKIQLILLVRNKDKMLHVLTGFSTESITLYESSVEDEFDIKEDIDYIIHCAAPTKSAFFAEFPVNTMSIIAKGTENILNLAKKKNVSSIISLSSMEVYGEYDNVEVCSENDLGYLSLCRVRNSYPVAKRYSELLCYSYFKQFSIPVKNIRLAQVFGAGILESENRVYKQFCESILNRKDIILHSTGESFSNFCYSVDAVIGILKVLIDGVDGETYNIAANFSEFTIKDIAEWLIDTYGTKQQQVKIIVDDNKYAVTNKTILNNEKINALGWTPHYNIKDSYFRLLEFLRNESK